MTATELPRLGFVHIPKTAGVSVGAHLTSVYGALTFDAYTTLDYQAVSDEALRQFWFYKGHMYRSDYERLPAETVLFSVLRDPAERVISLYRYYREIGYDHLIDDLQIDALRGARSKSIQEFCYSRNPFLQHQIRLGQIRQFLPPKLVSELLEVAHLSRDMERNVIDEFSQAITKVSFFTTDYLELALPVFLSRSNVPPPSKLERLNVSSPYDAPDRESVVRAREIMMDISPIEYHCFRMVQRAEGEYLCRVGPQALTHAVAPAAETVASAQNVQSAHL
jgi:hypothetical protein